MLNHLSTIKKLKKNFSLIDAIRVFFAIRKNKTQIKSSKNSPFFLRKETKDYETFGEIFLDHIYNIPLPIEPKNIIDAGANVGLASRFFKMKYPDASIVLIEIDAGNIEMIHKNMAEQPNITILNKGLYNTSTYFKIYDPYNATNSFVVKESDETDYDIQSVTIDQILKEQNWNEVDILKIDIEGAEKQLFESNYESWLPKVKILMVETHDRMVPKCSITVMKALDRFGFGLFTTTEGGTLIYYHKELLNI